MSATILNGKNIANKILIEIKNQINKHLAAGVRNPGLAVIKLGQVAASNLYVANKIKACNQVGIISIVQEYNENLKQQELLEQIDKLNKDQTIDGILVQLPLPEHICAKHVQRAIAPHKDVDGFNPVNLGSLINNAKGIHPCTPKGIMTLLNATGENLVGKHAVVLGVSTIVGRPMLLELLNANAFVTACNSKTPNIEKHIAQADILIVATGNLELVKGKWIKPGAIVIDVGINRDNFGNIKGDVEFETAKEVAAWITPVPGGVGPMTVASLIQNTYEAYLTNI